MSKELGVLVAAHLLIDDAAWTIARDRAAAEDRRHLAEAAAARRRQEEETRLHTEREVQRTRVATRTSAMIAGGGVLAAIGLPICIFLFRVAEDATIIGADNYTAAPGFTHFAAIAALIGLPAFGAWYGYQDRDRESFSNALGLAMTSGIAGAMFFAGFSTVLLSVVYYTDEGLAAVFPAAITGVLGGGFAGAVVGAVAGLLYCASPRMERNHAREALDGAERSREGDRVG